MLERVGLVLQGKVAGVEGVVHGDHPFQTAFQRAQAGVEAANLLVVLIEFRLRARVHLIDKIVHVLLAHSNRMFRDSNGLGLDVVTVGAFHKCVAGLG